MGNVNIRAIAHTVYEVNRAYSASLGDNSFGPWNDAPEWQKQTNILGVIFMINNPNAKPQDSHESWLKEKAKEGWKYGPVKDAEKKEHPCILPYDELPAAQKAKDALFIATVSTLLKYKWELSVE